MDPQDDWNDARVIAPPEGLVVDTKIDDGKGVRNKQPLKRRGSLWFFPDGLMYVYYRPTHWREIEGVDKLTNFAK